MSALESTARREEALIRRAYRAFFSPPRYESRSADRAILARGRNTRLPFAGGELAVTVWDGPGPTVLLMHGWGGSRAQMTGFVEPLLAAGYRVAAYDQPAHGESDGSQTNLLEISPTLLRVAEREGPFHAILAHSFGTLITSYAIVRLGLPAPARLVFFGAFNRLLDSLPRFLAQANLPQEFAAGLQRMLIDEFGRGTLEAIANEELAPQTGVPALMFHDTADPVTPLEDSRALARAWGSARLVETSGLGHRGALQSEAVIAETLQFLQA